MNVKLTPMLLILALVLVTLVGPLTLLQDIDKDPGQLASQDYWQTVGAITIASFAKGAIALIALLATTLGIPVLRGIAPPRPPSETDAEVPPAAKPGG